MRPLPYVGSRTADVFKENNQVMTYKHLIMFLNFNQLSSVSILHVREKLFTLSEEPFNPDLGGGDAPSRFRPAFRVGRTVDSAPIHVNYRARLLTDFRGQVHN